ncbi:MAG TPA: ROK family transcriptional regulator [Actinocrinis sp.]|jgi:predicted NBD/HSP70 family sugar kinase|uniref:ROK family transcriptional regulator n=1 Tax=Actinocrinis sp. TaxID=1920516 RepID=UPI002DDCEE4D|nr:ROK family transcriptional regulator [Actinocrinis sp.]HEV3171374.1 ROK family transcriptional regulator [Actinocrinis sp.]
MTPRPATPQTARAINDRAALELFAARGALTAGQLQEATGLARPTVMDLLARLGEGGLIEQIGEVGADRRGPNARLYALAGHRARVAGVDVRTHVVRVAMTDLAGHVLARHTLAVPHGAPDAIPDAEALKVVTDDLAEALRAGVGADKAPLHGVTIGMPGLIDPATGMVRPTSPAAFWHADLAAELRAALAVGDGLPPATIVLENEVNLAGIAEYRATGTGTFGLLWLDRGIGACLVLDGVLRRGASGGAGELGFLQAPGTTPRGPDSPGCAGGLWELIGADAVRSLAAAHGTTPDDFGHERFRAELAERVALGVAAFALVVDPGVVVLGGELGRAGGALLADAVERHLAQVCPVPTRVVATAVPGNPILAGAVATALDRARAELWP